MKMIRIIFVFTCSILLGCAASPQFSSLPEPERSWYAKKLIEEPNSEFAKACHGNQEALHSYFIQADQPLDGAAGEGFSASMIAIKDYMGAVAFYNALRKEPLDIQKAVSECAFAKDFIPDSPSTSTEQGAAANP